MRTYANETACANRTTYQKGYNHLCYPAYGLSREYIRFDECTSTRATYVLSNYANCTSGVDYTVDTDECVQGMRVNCPRAENAGVNTLSGRPNIKTTIYRGLTLLMSTMGLVLLVPIAVTWAL